MRDRKMQRALMQFFKPENYFAVREALIEAGRSDLIGGCEGLIPAQPPKEAIEAKRRQANEALRGDHYHTVAKPAKGEEARGAGSKQGIQAGKKVKKETAWEGQGWTIADPVASKKCVYRLPIGVQTPA